MHAPLLPIRPRATCGLAALALLLAATDLAAQDAGRGTLAAELDLGSACALSEQDGELWGLGPDYRVRFLGDGIVYTPALGPAATASLPLRFTLTGIGRRGAGALAHATPASVSWSDRTVRYRRGAVTETYEVRADGVEQSFVFDALPPGDGDLVVRGTITTGLTATAAADGGVDFLAPGLGGVHVGAVTGIDAAGRRARGAVAFAAGVLELSLPAAFVAGAALPLVLDPLVGTTIQVSSGGDDMQPDVAARISGPTDYLAVWARTFSGGDVDIRGQRIRSDGSLEGSLIGIRTHASLRSDQPCVAAVQLRDRYVVLWREASGTNPSYLAACSVDAASGAVSTAVQVVAGADSFAFPALGGDSESLDDKAYAVWTDVTQNRIEAARLVVSTTGAVSRLGRTILSGSDLDTAPAIAQQGGRSGRYLIAWETTSRTDWTLSAVIVDRFLNVIDRPILVPPSSTIRRTGVDVSGDGTHWVVGYDRATTRTPPDVYCTWVTLDAANATAYVGPEVLVEGGTGTETGAAVMLMGRSLVVGERQLNTASGLYGGFVRSLDHFTCAACEGFFTLESTTTRDVRAIACAGDANDALLVWHSADPSTGRGTVKARKFLQATGSSILVLNSACGPDVAVHATCARPGNFGFHMRMEHGEPSRPAFVLLQPGNAIGRAYVTCGSCTTVLDPFRSLVFPAGTTDVHGNAAVHLPIPASTPAGAALTFQFGVVPAAAAGCPAIGLSFSRVASFSL